MLKRSEIPAPIIKRTKLTAHVMKRSGLPAHVIKRYELTAHVLKRNELTAHAIKRYELPAHAIKRNELTAQKYVQYMYKFNLNTKKCYNLNKEFASKIIKFFCLE